MAILSNGELMDIVRDQFNEPLITNLSIKHADKNGIYKTVLKSPTSLKDFLNKLEKISKESRYIQIIDNNKTYDFKADLNDFINNLTPLLSDIFRVYIISNLRSRLDSATDGRASRVFIKPLTIFAVNTKIQSPDSDNPNGIYIPNSNVVKAYIPGILSRAERGGVNVNTYKLYMILYHELQHYLQNLSSRLNGGNEILKHSPDKDYVERPMEIEARIVAGFRSGPNVPKYIITLIKKDKDLLNLLRDMKEDFDKMVNAIIKYKWKELYSKVDMEFSTLVVSKENPDANKKVIQDSLKREIYNHKLQIKPLLDRLLL